jgi:integrase
MGTADPTTKFQFTEARLKDWPTPKAGRIRLKDAGCPGLCLYVSPKVKDQAGRVKNNPKVFYFYAKANNRPVEIRLGTWPTLTVEEARKLAKTSIAPDPAKAAAAKRAIREESTLVELWTWFDLHHVSALRDSTARRYRDSWRLHIEPELGAKQLSAIRRVDVQAMADNTVNAGKPKLSKDGKPIRKTGGNGAGRHACAVLSAMFHAATKDDALQYRGDIPTAGIRRPKVASRARFLQPGELPAFIAALADEPQPWKLFWTCCLFVGLRRGNVASARWADVSLDLGQWAVPEERSKTGAYLLVPIPVPVLDQLRAWKEELPARLLEANEARQRLLIRGDAGARERLPMLTPDQLAESAGYLFPAALALGKPSTLPHVTDPKASWRRVLLRAKLLNLRPHDLRRSIGSWMALGGVGLPIIGAALGHKDQRSTAVYARLNDGAVRAAMERATEAMLSAGEIRPGA